MRRKKVEGWPQELPLLREVLRAVGEEEGGGRGGAKGGGGTALEQRRPPLTRSLMSAAVRGRGRETVSTQKCDPSQRFTGARELRSDARASATLYIWKSAMAPVKNPPESRKLAPSHSWLKYAPP